jgi:hypothetical protein
MEKVEKMKSQLIIANVYMAISFLADDIITRLMLVFFGFVWIFFAYQENKARIKELELDIMLKKYEGK